MMLKQINHHRQQQAVTPPKIGHRFFLLDGLRGIAAIAVMLFHVFPAFPGGLISHGYLAVDFFFLLSGFVIALNYEAKLNAGMQLRRFVALRLIRLYPLAVAAVLSSAILKLIYPQPQIPDAVFLSNLIANALLIPNTLVTSAEKFPFLLPSWSLFCEIIVNLVYAFVTPILKDSILKTVAVIAGIALAYLTFTEGTVQTLYHNVSYGIIRTVFSFSLGVLFFRIFYNNPTRSKVPSIVIYAALILVVVFPVGIIRNSIYDLMSVMLIFPAILWASISRPGPSRSPIENELGELSYPIYLLHMPAASYAGVALGWAVGGYVLSVMTAVITLVMAALTWRFYDRPLRSWLSRKFLGRPNRTTLPSPLA